ncbi:hypothetical protein AL755_05715 [Arthrobacter sp. ERGS1:01]|uniref:thioredoxin domain-containing protein n=1 Tax=Arthrobacter sp. ERGS1:01 TaxID=1704044 RepID=UPI0006B603FD|nr:thioredoxin domain-containing protein [Arthrobacter sp. ERGS1:01]ALE05099.1 hypothetical protein AL755_05715 [Arthrobacter sp. ERGS1:01]
MNRLAGEPSAYLRQHAGNPVNWQPFDDAAFAEARERNVPVFLSVGYAACHWCHVMAHESFEDPAIGAYLNSNFVAIKVDREERPDVDDAYMAATQALSGEGGWPMSVFLTPQGQAFYAGTYFPPRPVTGRPSFRQVLEAVTDAWESRPEEVLSTARALSLALADPLWRVHTGAPASADAAIAPGAGNPEDWADSLDVLVPAAVAAMVHAEDPVHGGFGQAPKFPPTPALEFLIRHAARGRGESSHTARGLAGRTLGAMVNSALFDRLGGGFARYSVTADWSEPHYEKMLYDNAGLLRVLVHWIRLDAAVAGPPGPAGSSAAISTSISPGDARQAAELTVGWLLNELRLPDGAFASSLDADTVIDGVHHEGASYLWASSELLEAARQLAPADGLDASELAARVAGFMNLPATGAPGPFHPGRELTGAERTLWRQLRPALTTIRGGRAMPARDDKVVAAWNGMLLAALAEAAMVLERADYLATAVELGTYLRRVHWDGATLRRVSHHGEPRGIEGLLEDYAACADGFFALYAATADSQWFDFAGTLVDAAGRFLKDGSVASSAGEQPAMAGAPAGARFADPFDNATASPVALLADVMVTASGYTGSAESRRLAENLLGSLPELVRRAPRSAGGMLAVAEAMTAGPAEVAIVGEPGPDRDALVRRAWASPSPGMVIAVWDGHGTPPVPLLEGRAPTGGSPAGTSSGPALAYVCRNMVCARPVAAPADLDALLSGR